MYFTNENSTYKAQRLLKICLFALLPRYNLLYMCVSMRSYLTLSLPGVINKEFLSIMSKSREVMRRRKILYCVSKDQVLRTRIISKIWERVH